MWSMMFEGVGGCEEVYSIDEVTAERFTPIPTIQTIRLKQKTE